MCWQAQAYGSQGAGGGTPRVRDEVSVTHLALLVHGRQVQWAQMFHHAAGRARSLRSGCYCFPAVASAELLPAPSPFATWDMLLQSVSPWRRSGRPLMGSALDGSLNI